MQTINCRICGKEIAAGSTFCPYCGMGQAEEHGVEAPQWAPPVENASPVRFSPSVEKSKLPPINPADQYRPQVHGKSRSSAGWILFLRVLLWIFFGIMMLGTIGAVVVMVQDGDSDLLPAALGIFLGGTFVSFLTVSAGMIALNNADNIRKTTDNTEMIIDLLRKK